MAPQVLPTCQNGSQNVKKDAPSLPNCNPEKPKGAAGRGRSPEDQDIMNCKFDVLNNEIAILLYQSGAE